VGLFEWANVLHFLDMQYRHIYHAGNFADVFKHSILIMLMQSLFKKDKAIFYLDTHAGIGRYDLTSKNAQKTREYENGIARLYNLKDSEVSFDAIKTYLKIVRDINNGEPIKDVLKFYPGSPYIVRSLLRSQDQMTLVELYPEDAELLKQEFQGDKRVAVHYLNGYQSIKAFLPPKKGQGINFD
jgi:23S rRNA (adenine2030-N6)-methyltransferase